MMRIFFEFWLILEKGRNFLNLENEFWMVVWVIEKYFGKFLVLKVKCFIWN